MNYGSWHFEGPRLTRLNQKETAYTDSLIAGAMLADNILDKTTAGTKSLEVLEKQAELRSEIAQPENAFVPLRHLVNGR